MSDAAETDLSLSAAGEPSYAFQPSLLGNPHFFRLGADALHWELGRFSGQTPYHRINEIRLSFRPVTLASYRFIAEIWSEGAPKITISSTSWRSLVEHQRQDAEYGAFVRELCRRIGAAGGRTVFTKGASPFLYWPGVVVCAVFALALPYILLRAVLAGSIAGALIVGGLLVVFGWQIGNTFWRNRPGTFQPDNIPSTILPGR